MKKPRGMESAPEFVGPDAHSAQETPLAPGDAEHARRSVDAADEAAEHPSRETEELRRRFDEAIRDVEGPPPAPAERRPPQAVSPDFPTEEERAERVSPLSGVGRPGSPRRPARATGEPPSSETAAEEIVDQFFGLDETMEGREGGSAPKGGYFDVERQRNS